MNFIDRRFKQLMEQTDIDEKLRDKKGTQNKKFNWLEFAKLESLQELWSYANERLDFINAGSSRRVFILSSRFVLKIAKNDAGKAQNQYEYQLSQDPKLAPILARVRDAHPDGLWVVSDLVRPFHDGDAGIDDFESVAGFSFHEMFANGSNLEKRIERLLDNAEIQKQRLTWLLDRLKRAQASNDQDEIRIADADYAEGQELLDNFLSRAEELKGQMGSLQNPKLLKYREAIEYAQEELDLAEGDTEVFEHWGKTPDGRVVFLDYGLSDGIFAKHYAGF